MKKHSLFAVMFFLILVAPGRSQENALDSIRVRAADTVMKLDSMWSDSVWRWAGPCSTEVLTFQFDYGDTTFRRTTVPCHPALTETMSSPTPASLYTEPAPPSYFLEWSISRFELEQITAQPMSSSCFPPLQTPVFKQLVAEVDRAIFEADKCAQIEKMGKNQCLTKAQAQEALLLIPSEDRRLETLFSGFIHFTFWTEEDIAMLFELQFIRERALATFESR